LSGEPLGALREEVLPDSGSQALSSCCAESVHDHTRWCAIGDGRQWLTSRLLVFAIVLQELRDLRCLVVTASFGNDGEDRLVGTVTPDDLRRAFMWEYPWIDAAVAGAWQQDRRRDRVRSPGGADPESADRLLHDVALQLAPAPGSPSNDPEWVYVRGRWEHARWVDLPTLSTALGKLLDHRRVTADSVSDVRPDAARAAGGSLVPVVDHENRFLGLWTDWRCSRHATVNGCGNSDLARATVGTRPDGHR